MLDNSINLISCPTCGRCRIDLVEIAKDVEKMITSLEPEMEKYKPGKIDVAVMGCVVNGYRKSSASCQSSYKRLLYIGFFLIHFIFISS